MKILSLSITLFFCLSPTKIEGSDDKCSSVLKELKEIQLQVQKLNQKVDDVVKSVMRINEENNIPDSQGNFCKLLFLWYCVSTELFYAFMFGLYERKFSK